MARKHITAIVCGLLVFIFGISGILGPVNKHAEDALYHKPATTSDTIRIIKIDDKTLNQLGDYGNWNRSVYADLVNILCVDEETKPAVIGFDILFHDYKDQASDVAFAEACKQHGNVVCGFSYVFSKELVEDGNGNLLIDYMHISETVLPYDELLLATKQGFVNALMDQDDGFIRSTLLRFEEPDGTCATGFSSLVFESYMTATQQDITYPTEDDIMRFRYSGGIAEYESVSLCDVFDNNEKHAERENCYGTQPFT